MPAPEEDPYDRLPYTDHAYAESHPDRLATVALLSGWEPPAVEAARVLELGCGRGGNLLPMASGLPRGALTGVDRSRRQIDEARTVARGAGLRNVDFVEASFDDGRAFAGPYDYVLAHGVASWVPPASRRALLATIGRALAPGGVAYVSVNVLPGWYERLAARDWWRFDRSGDPKASMAWLRDRVSPESADYRRRLEKVAARVAETDVAYFTHEYLADEHHPMLVRAFLAEAAEAGLAYLGDAIPAETAFELLDDDARARALGMDAPEAQQLLDFVRNTAFRRALFVRADDAAKRGWRWSPLLRQASVDDLRVASRLRPVGDATPGALATRFDAGDVSVQIADPTTRRALRELAGIAPLSLPLPELARRVDAGDTEMLRREMFELWLATGVVDLHRSEPTLVQAAGERPLACPVARWRAREGGPVTNRWHQEVRLDDAPLRRVLALLDGTRTRHEVSREAGFPVEVAHASIEALAAVALLVA